MKKIFKTNCKYCQKECELIVEYPDGQEIELVDLKLEDTCNECLK